MSVTKRHYAEQKIFRAERHHADQVSPRAIVQRYLGGDPRVIDQARQAQYYDTTLDPGRQELLQAISDARQSYERLPDSIKLRFGSFQQLHRFMVNPANRAEAIKIGLLKPEIKPPDPNNSEKILAEIRDRLPPPEVKK